MPKDEFLTLTDLVRSKIIFWIDSYPTMKKLVERELKGKNRLRIKKVGTGNSSRYYIRKKDAENFVKEEARESTARAKGFKAKNYPGKAY